MATLFLRSGTKVTGLLFSRGFPHLFSIPALSVFFVVYTLLACVTSGLALPSGLFIPHMLIGGSFGRIAALLEIIILEKTCMTVDPRPDMSPIFWEFSGYRANLVSCEMPDPGAYALVGAAAVLGGSGRITVFLAVVLLELTNDIKMMPVIALVVIIAMGVGNIFNHGLYHALIPLQAVPFLNSGPSRIVKDHRVKLVMTKLPLVCLPLVCDSACIATALASTHNGFPVMCNRTEARMGYDDDEEQAQEQARESLEQAQGEELPEQRGRFSRFLRRHISEKPMATSTATYPCGMISRTKLEQVAKITKQVAKIVAVHLKQRPLVIHLGEYMERAPFTVTEDMSLARAYDLFRSQSMRHLCVVNRGGELVGLLTRKELMEYRLNEALGRKTHGHGFMPPNAHGGAHGHDANTRADRESEGLAQATKRDSVVVSSVQPLRQIGFHGAAVALVERKNGAESARNRDSHSGDGNAVSAAPASANPSIHVSVDVEP